MTTVCRHGVESPDTCEVQHCNGPELTKQQALNTIDAIIQSNGYLESDGDLWLGVRLEQLRQFILRCEQ